MEGRINPPKILVVGNINYDILLPLDRLPGPHEKMACHNARTGFGGSAANTAHWLARLGVQVTLAGAVGRDLLGQAHLDQLHSEGVDIRGVRSMDENTGIAVIFSLGREKRMVRTQGANLMGEVLPELMEERRLVYLSGADTKTLKQYAELANRKGVPVICGWHGAQDEEVARLADGFVMNSDEVRQLTGLADPVEGIVALDASTAAVTLSSGGCVVSRGIDVLKVPARQLEPVDRTGGGDAFAAGFLAGLISDLDIKECGRWGNELAALVIMEMGARPGISVPNGMLT